MRYAPQEQKASCAQHLGLVICAVIFLISTLLPKSASADDELPFEEGSVFVNVSGVGGTELDALFRDEHAFLSVAGLFQFLKINHQLSADNGTVRGFFLSENNSYTISKSQNQITIGGKTYALEAKDLIQTFSGLYLRSEIFGKVFGLECIFNFRSLSINIKTQLDLPVVREKRQALMRQNLSKIKQEAKADTIIPGMFRALNLGAYDWTVSSTQQSDGNQDTRLTLRLGTIVAGGETNLTMLYDSRRNLNLRDQQYLWRYVNNDRKGLRQIRAGKIPVQATSTLYAPVIGVQFTNSPSSYRRSFGSYDLSDHTEPGWTVELYINNVLVDYVKADASGFFSFKVPLMYGSTNVQLRYFGPWGEERLRNEKINVPYNFLPEKELEYTFTAGMLENGEKSRFSRLDAKYGLSDRITIGTGTEYLSTLRAGSPVMPFVNASARIGSSLILSGDYTYGVRGTGALNYRLPENVDLQLTYTRYKKDQEITFHSFLEERKAMISKPFRTRKVSGYSRLTINQIIYPHTRQTTGDLLLSASAKGVGVNLTTYAQQTGTGYLNVYSKLALSIWMPGRILFRPQIQYGYKFSRIQQVRTELERQVFKIGYLNISYQDNLNAGSRSVNLGLRFDLSFARTSFSARNTDRWFAFSQSLSGGGLLDMKTNYSKLNNRTNVGKGGLIVYPFLDLNLNNRRDPGEPKVGNLDLQVNGGRMENSLADTTIRVLGLEAYNSYLLEVKPTSFDNIAYQLKNRSYRVAVEPNKLKLVEIPVLVAGEASGMVYAGNGAEGQGRIIVNFFRAGLRVAGTISESDGYFTYLGLPPGTYTAQVDSAQLEKLNLSAAPQTFTIKKSLEGDIADGLDLRLLPRVERQLAAKKSAPVPESVIPAGPPAKKPASEFRGFTVVARGTGDQGQALGAQRYLANQTGYSVEIGMEGSHSYQVRIRGIKTQEEARRLLARLSGNGFKNPFVVPQPSSERPAATGSAAGSTPPEPAKTARNNTSRYAVIVGKASQASELLPLQAIIRQTLRMYSLPMKKGGAYSLQILGFRDEASAVQALRKLKARGISGDLMPYSVKEVRTVPVKD